MQETIKPPMGTDAPLIEGKQNYETITEKIGGIVLKSPPKIWYPLFALGFAGTMVMVFTICWLLLRGIGIWGVNQPVGWGFDIINFVWWIGIGHAGTLISAILLLLRQQWRTSINRFSEAMTIFAVMCAGMFPLLHTGRPWLDYWLFPLPNWLAMWPQFRSPLLWDVFAVSTYFTVSLLFWYTGLIPDFASLRDRAKGKIAQLICGTLSLGWRGSAKHWMRYESAYLLLAGLSTPLVLSVHSVVSLDFATSIVPGWHVTVFPPYFVAGAIYAGFAMVITLAVPFRMIYPQLKDYITNHHLDMMAKVMLATGLIVFYGYMMEAFYSFYSANQFETYMIENRFWGPYSGTYWALMICNGLIPQLLWFPRFRHNLFWLYGVSMVVNVGMWLERFVIISVSLHREYKPSGWGFYSGTQWDWSMFIGTIFFFVMMMFLFARFMPMIAIFEMRDLWHRLYQGKSGHNGHAPAHVTNSAEVTSKEDA